MVMFIEWLYNISRKREKSGDILIHDCSGYHVTEADQAIKGTLSVADSKNYG